ncbi:GntR family transcriptional regulator [Amycolatopsis rhabdoformis]|uniref:GntR family transcriptional regulator n=1 Tax=Amycolatopsis rhabdoformis TaxID=1448059 RepID=A0ABZ1IJU7_9PSEU|nr:GntR family transcriptional regulator [Amycolatopsis rhabdoformis]WSE34136.1 GntR family transcriptional regulator [Amycolatopsis rhabdoformis]
MGDKETRNERVYLGIRTEILSGKRRPGERLATAELTKTFDSSVGVVRESLLRLSERGLVQVRPMQGFFVADVSLEDLHDLTEARLDIETLALRYSIEQGDAEWEARLVGAHHLLSLTHRHVDGAVERFTADWGKAHGAFHAALIDGCRNRRILSVAQRLRDSAELYRRWSVEIDPYQDRDIEGEHDALLRAALDHDTDRAVALLVEHIQKTQEVLRQGF